MIARVASLHVYPVKSCSGIDLQNMSIGVRGPSLDREWMVVDEATNGFLTQRQLTQLATVRTRLTESSLIISIPRETGDSDDISLPIQALETATVEVKVWSDTCRASEAAPLASEMLSDFLGTRVRLVRIAPRFERKLAEKYGHPSSHVGFVDQMPILLTSMASLAVLNIKLPATVPMNRFRPNIVIDAQKPFLEDNWTKIRIGDIEFSVAKPCSRCVIINTDQSTGQRNSEPLKTLSTFRRAEGGKVLFGQYLIHERSGTIKVGDEVAVI